jgi:hypothetical protein
MTFFWKMVSCRQRLVIIFLIMVVPASLQVSVAPAAAQSSPAPYPTRPITLIVPFVAGGGVDTTARILAERFWREAKKRAEIHLANVSIWRKQKRIDNEGIVLDFGLFFRFAPEAFGQNSHGVVRVFAASRCARWDGAGTLRVPDGPARIACDPARCRNQRVRNAPHCGCP